MNFKSNKGITLTTLIITIIVMLIITSIIIYDTNSHITKEKVNKLYNDIEILNSKIDDYFLKYGEIPTIGNMYCTKSELKNILNDNARKVNVSLASINNININPNDGNEYNIIDLEKLEGLTLNYGYSEDYKTSKNTPNSITTKLDKLYIINKVTHQIYYPNGIIAGDYMYYTYKLDTNLIN